MTGYVPLTIGDLGLAALLVVIGGVLSIMLSLRFEAQLAVALVRMIVQLILAATTLKLIFNDTSAWSTLAAIAVVAAAFVIEIAYRPERRYARWAPMLAGSGSALAAGLAATLVALIIVQPSPWYAPRFMLPLLGIIAGNALTSAALVIDAMTVAAVRERSAIETRLALGDTRAAAFAPVLRRGLHAGLMPLIVMLSTIGIVTLPGMMTGQVLSGVPPVEAAKYQILLMFLIAGASVSAAIASGFITLHFLTDARQRLRLDRLQPISKEAAKMDNASRRIRLALGKFWPKR